MDISQFKFIPLDNEKLQVLISRVHLSFSTSTDNVIDRIIKMRILENNKFDAFSWLISLGPTQLNGKLIAYGDVGKELKTFNVGYRIESFNSTFDWDDTKHCQSWNVTGKINFIS